VPQAFYFKSTLEVPLALGLGSGSVLGSFFFNSNINPSGLLLVTFTSILILKGSRDLSDKKL